MNRRTLTTAAAALALGGTLLATAGTAGATASHWTPADKRLCHGMATFPRTHASVPTVRELAYDSTYANGWLQQDAATLVAYALAPKPYGKQLTQVKRDCAY